jgi:serine/threonine-protein kinase
MRLVKGIGCGVLAVAMFGAVGTSRAQSGSASDKVTAEALFEDGRKLMAEGRYADACARFGGSQRLDPSPSTLLNLASCWEKLGRSATAWATYREAASAANASGRKDYVSTAQRHADGLEPKLARMTVNVAQPVEGMRVQRDGLVVDRAEWGVAIPIDTGPHTIAADAPGYARWESTVDVARDGANVATTVPPLQALPQAPIPAQVPAASAALAPEVLRPEPVGSNESAPAAQLTVGWIIGGAGVAGLAVGAIFAVNAKNTFEDSLHHCEATNQNLCDSTGVAKRGDARSAGDAATVAFGLGAAALVAGGVLWLTAPRPTHESGKPIALSVGATLGGMAMRGAW